MSSFRQDKYDIFQSVQNHIKVIFVTVRKIS